MVTIRKDLVLVRQVRAAGIHQVDAGQVVLLRHFLRPQVLFHRHRVVGAALYGGVVADHHAVDATDAADAGNQAGPGCIVVVHVQRSQRCDLKKRRAGVQQQLHAVARQQLAAADVSGAGSFTAALRHLGDARSHVIHQRLHGRRIGLEVG